MAFVGAWGQWYEESEHPRGRGGKWVSKGGSAQTPSSKIHGYGPGAQYSLSEKEVDMMNTWGNPPGVGQGDYEVLRESREFGEALDKLPQFRGPVYRGLALDPSQMTALKKDAFITIKKHSAAAKSMRDAEKAIGVGGVWTGQTENLASKNFVILKIKGAKTADFGKTVWSTFAGEEVAIKSGTRIKITDVKQSTLYTMPGTLVEAQVVSAKDFSATRAAAAKVQQARKARAEYPSDEVLEERYVLKDAPLPSQSIIVPKALLVQEHLTNVVDREVLVNPTERQLLEISKEDSLGLVRLLVDKHNNVYAWDAGHIIHDTMTKALRKLGATGLPEITKDLGGAAPGVYEWDLTVKRPFAEPTYLGDERMSRHDVIEAGLAAARKTREYPSDELTPAEEILKQGGTPEYRRLDTPYLRKTLADYEAEAAKYPKEGEWIRRSAEKYRKELEWREAVTQVRKESPTSVGDITETFDVDRRQLEEYSSPIQVGDIEYRIGQGVGYSPLEGGDYVMMDGLIVQGPRDRLAKPASDYPDVEAAIEKKYKESLTWQGGDFSKAQPTQYRHLVGKLLWGYKSPLTSDTYAAFMNKLAAGYFSNGQVVGDAKDNQIELAKKNLARDLKEGDAEHKEWVQKWYDREFKGVRMIQAMMREIRDAEWKASMVSQEAVNQFAAFVKDTQVKLKEAHPNEESLTLYRGVQGDYAKELKRVLKKEEEAEIDVSPIDSWSTDESVARKFATRSGAVIKKQVPISEILFSHEGPRGSGLSSSDYLFGGQSEAEQLWGHSEPRMRVSRSEVS